MAESQPVSKVKGRLTQRLETSSDNQIRFESTDSDRSLSSISMSDFGDHGYLIINPDGSVSNYEIAKFDSWSVSNGIATVSIVNFMTLQGGDASSSPSKIFNSGTPVIVGDNHHWYNHHVDKGSDETIDGVKTFSKLPETTAGDPTEDNDLVRKAYADSQATGTATVNKIQVSATAGESVSAGDLVYQKTSDGEWYKVDANDTSTLYNVNMGIARGSGSDGGSISNGVLIEGYDNNQSGLTGGSKVYASNTAGDIADSAGTNEKVVGQADTSSKIYFNPSFTYTPTKDEKDALNGTQGSPDSSNSYVTDDDTATTSTADRVVRGDGSGLIDSAWLNGTLLPSASNGQVVYYDGSDWKKANFSELVSHATDEPIWNQGLVEFSTASSSNSFTRSNRVMMQVGATYSSGNSNLTVSLSGFDTTVDFSYKVSLKMSETSSQSNRGGNFGFGENNTSFGLNDYSNLDAAVFEYNNGTLQALTSDGSGNSPTTTTISGVTVSNYNEYEIKKNGTDIEFYVNGNKEATHSEEPSNSSLYLGYGVRDESSTDPGFDFFFYNHSVTVPEV